MLCELLLCQCRCISRAGVVVVSCPPLQMLVPDLHICHSKQHLFAPGISLRYSRLLSPVPPSCASLYPIECSSSPSLSFPHFMLRVTMTAEQEELKGSEVSSSSPLNVCSVHFLIFKSCHQKSFAFMAFCFQILPLRWNSDT